MTALSSIDFPVLTALVSALAAFALGMFWYHPRVMGARWMEARGRSATDLQPQGVTMVYTFLLWLVSACFYSFLAELLGAHSVSAFISLSCLFWVAFAMPPTLMGALYTGNSMNAVAIDSGYQLAGYYAFAVVHIIMNAAVAG